MNPTRPLFRTCLLAMCLLATPAAAQQASRMCGEGPAPGDDLLALDLASLLEVKVITASKSSETLSDAPGVIAVVGRDELRRFGGMTLREALERVPGLTGASSYFTDRSLVAVRGDLTKANGGHMLILVNGRPSREVLEGGLVSDLLESFPVNILERIEVIKGPGSVLYGSNAFSAVVNLIVQKADRNGVVLSGSGGRAGAFSTSALATVECGALNVVGTVQFHARPDWATPYRYPSLGDPFAKDAKSVSSATIRDRAPSAFLGADYKGFGFISSFTQWESANFVRGEVGANQWRREFADVGYTAKAAAHWDVSANATYTRNTFDATGNAKIARESRELVLEWTNVVNPTPGNRLTFGGLYNHIQGHEIYLGVTPSITISEGSRPGGAVYAQLDHRLDSLKVIGGFQANKIGALDVDVVPRAGAIWSPDRRVTVKALYGKAFRAPSINETRLNHPGLAGNPNLVPEKVATFDIGVTYHEDRVQAGVNYFRSRQTNSITVDTSEARWKYQNLGEATFQGLEFEGKYYVKKDFFLLGSALYQTNEDGDGNTNVTPIPNVGVKAGVSYESANGLTASIFDRYDGAVNGYAATLNPGPGAHHIVNALVRLEVTRYWQTTAARSLALFINADNMTNQQVWLPDWGGNTGDTVPVNRGRTIYFGVEVSLRDGTSRGAR
jgi:outer membrane receptor for ferrienterochelin and colicins